MSEILNQLALDQTFFIQFAILGALYFILSGIYFKPFQKLLENRRQKTVADREEAARVLAELKEKLNEYESKMADAQKDARARMEAVLTEAKKKEAEIIAAARNDAKNTTQAAIQALNQEKEKISKSLESEVEALATQATERLLLR